MSELTLMERVELILAKHGVTPRLDGQDVVSDIGCGTVGCKLRISPAHPMLRCLISFPVFVAEHQRLAMAETICRINHSMYSGALELDMEDGELRFRNAVPLLDTTPSDEQLDWLIFWSWGFMRRYCPALLDVAVGLCDPEVAIAKVEAEGAQMLLEERLD
jgi:hypothetical protein